MALQNLEFEFESENTQTINPGMVPYGRNRLW